MANPIFHSQYTAAQIEDLIENGAPIIQNGYWWRWDVATQQYVNTNITADSETAAQAAEAAQAAAEDARDDAQDAQTAAETAQGLAEDARDAAAASAASIAASAAQIDANTKRINYVALREEEDRQILFGSVVEAAEDTYPELRSSPIHNAITIGGSVYPRMDNTRMAIDAIKGRTVVFNQLAPDISQFGAYHGTKSVSDGVLTFEVTTADEGCQVYKQFSAPSDHVVLATFSVNPDKLVLMHIGLGVQIAADRKYISAGAWSTIYRMVKLPSNSSEMSLYVNDDTALAVGDKVRVAKPQFFDLTAQYGTTLADSIYAMEQANAGAGVAYVRQRMDLDYYAANAGELKAPVVSGVGFTGKNIFGGEKLADDIVAKVPNATKNTQAKIVTYTASAIARVVLYDQFKPNTRYTIILRAGSNEQPNMMFVYTDGTDSPFPTTGADSLCVFTSNEGKSVAQLCGVWASGTTNLHYEESGLFEGVLTLADFEPYSLTSLSLPSTRLDGVGTAQDYIEAHEDGENDYALIKRPATETVDLGSKTWQTTNPQLGVFWLYAANGAHDYDTLGIKLPANDGTIANMIMAGYTAVAESTDRSSMDKVIWVSRSLNYFGIKDSAFVNKTVDEVKALLSGKMIVLEPATQPSETVIAEHLTLAEVSAIAENGGIISIVSETGHIVQPDMVADVVISRSAS